MLAVGLMVVASMASTALTGIDVMLVLMTSRIEELRKMLLKETSSPMASRSTPMVGSCDNVLEGLRQRITCCRYCTNVSNANSGLAS